MQKVGLVSLGCDKNRVDAEVMLGRLEAAGYEITGNPQDAEIIIVNTCAFIEAARQEAIDTIFEMNRFKQGNCKKLIVTGCLPQKYIDELEKTFHEVDVFCGTDACNRIVDVLKAEQRNCVMRECCNVEEGDRILTTAAHTAYVKIADGCDNHCTYCTIPSIRGGYRSRKIESIVAEAESLAKHGVKELILVAQDVTRYGYDFDGKLRLTELLRKLSQIDGIIWIRLLYCYPELITDELIEEIANNGKIAKYIDIPLQHSESRILKLMGRRCDKAQIEALLQKLRKAVPDLAVRTTFIVGFPSETAEEFSALRKFVEEQNFTNAGFFTYSKEAGTGAAKLSGQIHKAVKQKRLAEIAETQYAVASKSVAKRVGNTVRVLVDELAEENNEGFVYACRSEKEAPDVDGTVFMQTKRQLTEGSFCEVLITGFEGYDLFGDANELAE